ncbi:hypothetical protein ACMAZF_01340 [Psychrobium sp. nBUS_13]|uniref:hypothetical protein n=1 Tax=Psychrobium sp. nBUS_13 TaxID=3395319 RepID=UPI003EBC2A82
MSAINLKLITGAAVAALVLGAVFMTTRPNKNVRLNNPLNIEQGSDWDGLANVQKDERFCTFESPEYGFRAAYIILLRYLERDTNTINKIVATWAPAFENHVNNYANFVSNRTNIDVDSFVEPTDLPQIILAMADFEGAKGAYDISQVNQGIAIAHQAQYVIDRLAFIEENTSLIERYLL